MLKFEKVRINISTTFPMRARCKACGSAPSYYYMVRRPYHIHDHNIATNIASWIRNWIERMGDINVYVGDPRYILTKDISHFVDYKGYNPRPHLMIKSFKDDRNNVYEVVGCDCGHSTWIFTDKSAQKSPEIVNRKGRYKYPQEY